MKVDVYESISIFDIFKIGIGPSSSHTLGPWIASSQFARSIEEFNYDKIQITLYGSLSKTGKGHATDKAVLLGLEGHDPATISATFVSSRLFEISASKSLKINHRHLDFDPLRDIVFSQETLLDHPNTMIFTATYQGEIVLESCYYSIGGGFVKKKDEKIAAVSYHLPYPISTGEDLISHIDKTGFSISKLILENEKSIRTESEIDSQLEQLYETMLECLFQGCSNEGVLPGGLNVKRRAKSLCDMLLEPMTCTDQKEWFAQVSGTTRDFNKVNKWISCFALAVNEQNAAMGRIVTSPTNGAAGVIPAVLFQHICFGNYQGFDEVKRFMLVAGEIGCLFKKGATISAAVGGCQAEIGVSSAMAAAGLTEILGGSPRQVLMAAEIAMEHHLGLTCDPIGGLVQIPCIERNAMGAMKAITASNLALNSDPDEAIVKFDVIVKTMWHTALEMNSKYKETSEGGLAFNLPVILPNC